MKAFYDALRPLFGCRLKQSQVDGIECILAASEGLQPDHRAYLLATAFHETGGTMVPRVEDGAPSYFWKRSEVERLGTCFGTPMQVAAQILVRGCAEGWFTGRKLSDFQTFSGMRAVVGGHDNALLIADHADDFRRAIDMIPLPMSLPWSPWNSIVQSIVDALGGR